MGENKCILLYIFTVKEREEVHRSAHVIRLGELFVTRIPRARAPYSQMTGGPTLPLLGGKHVNGCVHIIVISRKRGARIFFALSHQFERFEKLLGYHDLLRLLGCQHFCNPPARVDRDGARDSCKV